MPVNALLPTTIPPATSALASAPRAGTPVATAAQTAADAKAALANAPATSQEALRNTYVPEVQTPNTSRPTGLGPLPSKQKDVLLAVANLAFSYSDPVSPGQATAGQKQVLNAWQENANSDYSQFMLDQGMRVVAENPQALFAQTALSTEAAWSGMDTKGALQALGLSAQDWDQYQKLEEEERKKHAGLIGTVVGIAAAIVVGYFTGGAGAAAGYEAGSAIGNDLAS